MSESEMFSNKALIADDTHAAQLFATLAVAAAVRELTEAVGPVTTMIAEEIEADRGAGSQ